MELSDQQFIAAGPADVYAALNDPEILKQCIPGCDELEKQGDTKLIAKITLKIGPIKATFDGEVELSNLNPPHGYTISGQGSGGAAGYAKGSADVALEEKDGGTMLSYDVKAQISGKIAQLGARLIDATAKKLAKQFFAQLATCLSPEDSAAEDAKTTPVETKKSNKKVVVSSIVAVVIIALIVVLATA